MGFNLRNLCNLRINAFNRISMLKNPSLSQARVAFPGNTLDVKKAGTLVNAWDSCLLRTSLEVLGATKKLDAVVHFKLNRMRRHAQTCYFFHLQGDVSIQEVVRKHTTTSQEFTILIQMSQGFIQ